MKMLPVAVAQWRFEVERGPDWLFVQVHPPEGDMVAAAEDFSDELWSLLEQHFTYRVVLEMDEVTQLSSVMIGQLVVLVKRVFQHGGVVRLCGMNDRCRQSLELCRLGASLPTYDTRHDAVLGPNTVRPK